MLYLSCVLCLMSVVFELCFTSDDFNVVFKLCFMSDELSVVFALCFM